MSKVTCSAGFDHDACSRCEALIHGPWNRVGPPPDYWEYGSTIYFSDDTADSQSVMLCRACVKLLHGDRLRSFVAEGRGHG